MFSIKQLNSFDDLKEDWMSLWKCLPIKYPFLTWHWQNTWWQVMGNGDLIIFQIFKDNKTIGIVPLRKEKDTIYWASGEEVSDYLDIIAKEADKNVVWELVLSELKKDGIKEINLRNIPKNSTTRSILKTLSQKLGLQITEDQEDVVPNIILPNNFEDYLFTLSRKNRHELRRKIRRFEEEGGDCNIRKTTKETLEKDCQYFFKLFRSNGENKKNFLTDKMEEFFCQVAFKMETLGMLDFSSLIFKDEIIAQTISFVDKERFYLYNAAVNPIFYHLSPGLMINRCLIAESIEKGRKIYDFMQGKERYKYQLGAKDDFVYKIVIKF